MVLQGGQQLRWRQWRPTGEQWWGWKGGRHAALVPGLLRLSGAIGPVGADAAEPFPADIGAGTELEERPLVAAGQAHGQARDMMKTG